MYYRVKKTEQKARLQVRDLATLSDAADETDMVVLHSVTVWSYATESNGVSKVNKRPISGWLRPCLTCP